MVYFSICEPAPIWICSVSVYHIDHQSQTLWLSLNISEIQINENWNILMPKQFRETSIATSDRPLPACGPLIGKQSIPHESSYPWPDLGYPTCLSSPFETWAQSRWKFYTQSGSRAWFSAWTSWFVNISQTKLLKPLIVHEYTHQMQTYCEGKNIYGAVPLIETV